MENLKNSFDRNLFLGILFPILFIVVFYTYYSIDLYYSRKLLDSSYKSESVTGKPKTDFKLLYTLDKGPFLMQKNFESSETFPLGTSNYLEYPINSENPAEIHAYYMCTIDTGFLYYLLVGAEGVGTADPNQEFIKLVHYSENQLYSYDFNTNRATPLECDSANLQISNLENYSILKSPDGLVDLDYSPYDYETSLYPTEGSDKFPYLVVSLKEKEREKDKEDKKPNIFEFDRPITVNGEVVDGSSIVVDPVEMTSFFEEYSYGNLNILGWIK